jgi:hypothetical protein
VQIKTALGWVLPGLLSTCLSACSDAPPAAEPPPPPRTHWTEPQSAFLDAIDNLWDSRSRGTPTTLLRLNSRNSSLRQCNEMDGDNYVRTIAYGAGSENFICEFYDLEERVISTFKNGEPESRTPLQASPKIMQSTDVFRQRLSIQTRAELKACVSPGIHPVTMLFESHVSGDFRFGLVYGPPSPAHCPTRNAFSTWWDEIRHK